MDQLLFLGLYSQTLSRFVNVLSVVTFLVIWLLGGFFGLSSPRSQMAPKDI